MSAIPSLRLPSLEGVTCAYREQRAANFTDPSDNQAEQPLDEAEE